MGTTKARGLNGVMDLAASQREYLATIFDLENTHRKARAKDIAERMGVMRGSVTGAMKSLAGTGFSATIPPQTSQRRNRATAKRIDKKHREKENSFVEH